MGEPAPAQVSLTLPIDDKATIARRDGGEINGNAGVVSEHRGGSRLAWISCGIGVGGSGHGDGSGTAGVGCWCEGCGAG